MAEALINPAARYSGMDRLWHRLAFSMIDMQVDLAARETRQHQADLMLMRPGPPVFITALPRAGTTLLLDVLAKDASFASTTYRDMPALFCPVTWRKFSARFRQSGAVQERAHGDGMDISVDSPEAFEEALWLHFWPDHFEANAISLWDNKAAHRDFEGFFDAYMRKIILNARAGGRPDATRYLSKNNGNLARTGWLKRDQPAAHVLVPFRHPAAHIASLLRQQRNFAHLHKQDAFAKRYMADLGHFEFGTLHRPLRFEHFSPAPGETPAQALYWARYWIAAYQHLLDRPHGEIELIDFDGMCETPGPGLRTLAEYLGLPRPGLVTGEAHRFRRAVLPDWTGLDLPSEIQQQADRLHTALKAAKTV